MTVLPPHYNDTVPSGYFVAKSDTTQSLVVGRVFINNYNNLTSAINTIKETRAYPLSELITLHNKNSLMCLEN